MEIELLYKKIEGTLTPDESVEVERWLSESEIHSDYFRRLERYYHGDLVSELTDDRMEALKISFEGRIENRLRIRRRKWVVAGMVAACVTFLGGIGLWIYSLEEKMGVQKVVSHISIEKNMQEVIADDTLQYYKEKKSNGKIFISLNDKSSYSIDDIPAQCGGYMDYDEGCGTLKYSCKEEERVVEMQKIRTAPGADLCVITEDGTKIWLNSDTEIEFPNIFDKDVRWVNVKGEAYFEVKKDSSRPFIVDANNMEIKVYGTQFNVNTRRKGMVATTLVEGSVAIQTEGSDTETFLNPGETGEYSLADGSLDINNDDIDLYVGWRKGSYHFRDTKLRNLFEEISHWYGIEVTFSDRVAEEESFSGIISRNMPLVDLLNLLKQTNYITYELSGNHLQIKENDNN